MLIHVCDCQIQYSFNLREVKEEILQYGGKRVDSVRFRGGIESAYLFPSDRLPIDLWEAIKSGKKE